MRALVQWQCFRAGLCLCLSFGTVAGAQTWDLIGPPGAVFIASSANGSNLVSREYLGYLQLSADSGASWSSGSDMAFGSLASSAKGVKLAGIFGNQYWSFVSPIYTSEDYGQSWTPTGSPTTNWAAIAMSADGTTIIAGHFGATWQTGGGMFVSTNSGQTWIRANVPDLWWSAVACSADGRRFVAGAWQDSIYISSDLGATWVPTAAPQKQWRSLACSTDATKLVASTADYYISYFSSTNSGATWLSFAPNDIVSPLGGVASSASGERMAVIASGFARDSTPCHAYISTNFGVYWFSTELSGTSNVTAIASSADGCSLVALAEGVYNYRVTPAPILNISNLGNYHVLSWIVPSINFGLQENPGLDPSSWSDVAEPSILDYSTLSYQVVLPTGLDKRFYRLISR